MLRDETFSIGPGWPRGWQLRVALGLIGTALSLIALAQGVSLAQGPPADPKSQAAAAIKSGEAFLEDNELEKAVAAFSQAIRLRPEDAKAYYSRACAYKRRGEPDKSRWRSGQSHRARSGRRLGLFPPRLGLRQEPAR